MSDDWIPNAVTAGGTLLGTGLGALLKTGETRKTKRLAAYAGIIANLLKGQTECWEIVLALEARKDPAARDKYQNEDEFSSAEQALWLHLKRARDARADSALLISPEWAAEFDQFWRELCPENAFELAVLDRYRQAVGVLTSWVPKLKDRAIREGRWLPSWIRKGGRIDSRHAELQRTA